MTTHTKDIAVEALRASAKLLREIEEALDQAHYERRDIKLTIGGRTWRLDNPMTNKLSQGVQDMREQDENTARVIEYANSHTKSSAERSKFFSSLPPFIVKNHFYPDDDE